MILDSGPIWQAWSVPRYRQGVPGPLNLFRISRSPPAAGGRPRAVQRLLRGREVRAPDSRERDVPAGVQEPPRHPRDEDGDAPVRGTHTAIGGGDEFANIDCEKYTPILKC